MHLRHVVTSSRSRIRAGVQLLVLAGVVAGLYAVWVPKPPACARAVLETTDAAAALI